MKYRRHLPKNERKLIISDSSFIWLDRSFFSAPSSTAKVLRKAWSNAQTYGKPLLVLVVPAKKPARLSRAWTLGSFLTLADSLTMALFALTEVVCTDLATLSDLLPSIDLDRKREPWMLLIDHHNERLEITLIDPPLPQLPKLDFYRGSQEASAYSEVVNQRNAILEEGLWNVMTAPQGLLEARAARASSILSAELVAKVRSGYLLTLKETSQAASILDFDTHEAALAESAIATLQDTAPQGSHWINDRGCGVILEGYEALESMVRCGIGHIPKGSQRFLFFFADINTQKKR